MSSKIRLNIDLDRELSKAFKRYCLANKKSMNAITVRMIKNRIRKWYKKLGKHDE